jgi:carboxypeptidase C (cathepsin A)
MRFKPLFALIAVTTASVAFAEKPTTRPSETRPAETRPSSGDLSTTEHEITIAGQPLKYQATAGRLTIRDDAGKAKADFFFVAYDKLPAETDPAKRPITFIFNGGPGSAAVWLHLGAVGPQRIVLDQQGDPPAMPPQLEGNPDTWLTTTDLVFIDPVGTGYSRPAEGEKAEQFFGVEADIKSVAAFIRLYLTRNERWLSPKFLAGESYGTTRAAGLSQYLLQEDGIGMNGIILISSVLDFQTIDTAHGNNLPYVLYLPSYAAVAWYHHKLAPDLQADLQKTISEAETWATTTYATALLAGASLPAEERTAVAKELSRFSGLPLDYVEKSNLRIDPLRFEQSLLSDERKVIGRFDGRITGFNPDPLNDSAEYDPSFAPYFAAYSAAFNDYARRTLKYESDLPYEVLNGKVQPWDLGPAGNGFLDVSHALQEAMLGNPHLRVMFVSGYFDLATPFSAANYTINHMELSPELRAQITHKFYEGGHMVYHYRPTLTQLSNDVRAFMTTP